ncbi:MAG TPA: hypothetical protein VLB44_04955 [Kofleriaceae bacterium]|nr:hypothetical protein [Kofleriaceae bacterium]
MIAAAITRVLLQRSLAVALAILLVLLLIGWVKRDRKPDVGEGAP